MHQNQLVGARWTGLSISETSDLLRFTCTCTVSRVYRELSENEKISNEGSSVGKNALIEARSQATTRRDSPKLDNRRLEKVVWSDISGSVYNINYCICRKLFAYLLFIYLRNIYC